MVRIAVPLRVPALLAVAVIAAMPSCEDNDGDTASESESGGPVDCADITEEAACDAAETCAWDGVCHLHCPKFEDEASCMMQPICYWTEGACDYGGV